MTDEKKTGTTPAGAGRGANLKKAKKEKNDEFYTRMEDVENELRHYKDQLRGKTILCNCDDPEWSSFWKYFVLNFEHLGLKKLVSTHYKKDGPPSYKMEYDGTKDADGKPAPRRIPLVGDGDFRSPECAALLAECDVVVSNPPFSLFREYVAMLAASGKRFLIIGNFNAVSYGEIFGLIRGNRLWLGVSPRSMDFSIPDGSVETVNAAWFTNMDNKKRREALPLYKTYKGHESDYPGFDNYRAINVNRVKDIPADYDGEMGVPITFLERHNPDQFEIVGLGNGTENFTPTKKYRNPKQILDDGEKTCEALNRVLTIKLQSRPSSGKFYSADGDFLIAPYARLIIKRKKETS